MHTTTDYTLLRNELKNALTQSIDPKIKGIRRISLAIKTVNLFDWLTQQTKDKKLYWANRDNEFEVACVGICDILTPNNSNTRNIISTIKNRLAQSSNDLHYYGGMCFNPQNIDKTWQNFGAYQFFVPRFEITKQNNIQTFICNFKAEDDAQKILDAFDTLVFDPITHPIELIAPFKRTDYPTKNVWDNIFNKIKKQIASGFLSKVVCARKSTFIFKNNVNPFQLKKHLHKMTPECYHFCFQTQEGSTFLGASPERLFKREGNVIKSEAIAGTRKKGANKEEDKRLIDELCSSPKELNEHQLVVQTIQSQLKKYCTKLEVDSVPSVLNLIGIHHLKTNIKGTLKTHVSDDQLLNDLQPTPAVCGLPADRALECITDNEPFARGWYSGIFGYVSNTTTEFTVAIRSGLIEQNTISLYAGAGIIDQSDQDAEWEEINNKMNHFAQIFKS